MQSNAVRVGLVAVLAAVAVVLFVVLRDDGGSGDGDRTTTTTATTTEATTAEKPPEPRFDLITISDGAPVGGVAELTYAVGETVRIMVRTDVALEEVHIHGYEVEQANVTPSKPARLVFKATIDGIFELEAHGPFGDLALAELVVEPS